MERFQYKLVIVVISSGRDMEIWRYGDMGTLWSEFSVFEELFRLKVGPYLMFAHSISVKLVPTRPYLRLTIPIKLTFVFQPLSLRISI